MVSEWQETTVGERFDLVNGFAFKSKDFEESGIPVIKIKNVKAGYFSEHTFSYVSPEFLETRQEKLARVNDLLISMSGNRHDGSPETWVGKIARFDHPGHYFINQRVGALRVRDASVIDPVFASYLLSSWDYQQLFISIATSSGGQANLSPTQILGASFEHPPLPEQKAIAHILGTLDDKIELNRRMNATLEGMAQALFKSWFVDFDPVIDNALAAGNPIPDELAPRAEVRKKVLANGTANREAAKPFPAAFQYTEVLGWTPEAWEVGCVSDLAELNPESWTAKNHPGSISYVDLAKTKNGRINETTLYEFGEAPSRARRVLKPHDTIIGTVRPGNRSFAYIHEDGLTGSTGFAVLRPNDAASRSFIYLGLTRDEIIEVFAHLADGAAYPAIRPDVVVNTRITIPSSAVLQLFEDQAAPLIAKVGEHQKEAETLSKVRDTLLPKLISGEIHSTQQNSLSP